MILVVDSSEEMREDVRFFLELAGLPAAIFASSFSEALSQLGWPEAPDTHAPMMEEEGVELILLGADLDDIELTAACRILTASPQWQHLPVLILRKEIPATQLEAALEAGAFDFINMPVFPTELAARLKAARRYKESLEQRRALERELIETTTQLQLTSRRYEVINEELRKYGDRDALTGLYNKRWFNERLSLELRSASRRGVPFSLLFLDLDHFHLFNEAYGREAGDRCLAAVASTIKKTLKRSIDSAARVGGEEFAILLPDTNARGAEVVALKLLGLIKALAIPHEKSPVAPVVTASIGIDARLPTPRLSNSAVILAADLQLQQAKKLGRNRHAISEPVRENQHPVFDKFF